MRKHFPSGRWPMTKDADPVDEALRKLVGDPQPTVDELSIAKRRLLELMADASAVPFRPRTHRFRLAIGLGEAAGIAFVFAFVAYRHIHRPQNHHGHHISP